ncbi:MAG: hypothetical protein RML35_10455 [Chloroherpetonaceae bacterium]|nr:hypothetical protein [Chloroherpetonaceae bacterium]
MAVASGDKTVKLLSSPELTVDEFIALEREARREIEQARKAAQSQPTPNGQGKSPYPEERRSGRERRKVSFWLGEGDRRSGQDR